MITESELKRWVSVMLISALRGHTTPEFITEQICKLHARYGPDVFPLVLRAMLMEARRLGPGHSDGSLYLTSIRVKSYVQDLGVRERSQEAVEFEI